MKRTPLKPFKRKEGVRYYPNSTIRVKIDKMVSKPVKRTKLRPVSAKTAKRNVNYGKVARARSIEMFGIDCCFVCGVTKNLCTHHFDKNRNNNEPENLFRLCPLHHDHMGSDGLKRVNDRIIEKLKTMKQKVIK